MLNIKSPLKLWGSDEILNVYIWHEHSHIKDSKASDPSEWQGLPCSQALQNSKASPGQSMYTAGLYLKPVHVGSPDHSFLIPDDFRPRLLPSRNPLLLSFQTALLFLHLTPWPIPSQLDVSSFLAFLHSLLPQSDQPHDYIKMINTKLYPSG